MSYLLPKGSLPQRAHQAQKSPSLESVLSSNVPSTLDLDQHYEWVIFSPQASESSIVVVEDESLSLPAHNGEGSFPPAMANDHLMDRVHRWSTEQSQLVYDELQRLERRLLWLNGDQDNEPSCQEPSMWTTLARRVHNLITLDDEVLDILFGNETPRASPCPEPHESAFHRSTRLQPHWDDDVVDKVLADIGVPRAPGLSLLRKILGWGLAPQENFVIEPTFTPPLVRDYWEDECSSISTELLASI